MKIARRILRLTETVSYEDEPADPYIEDAGVDAGLPLEVAHAAAVMYRKIKDPMDVGDSGIVGGFWIETHTLGCRREGGDPEDKWWECHYEFYDSYANDGASVVLGNPEDGVFVTVTPSVEKTK